MPGTAVTHEVGADGANAVIVDSGRVQLGLLHSGLGHLALEGEYPYDKKLENLRGISLLDPDSAFHFLVNEKIGLTSIEEIKQRKYPLRISVSYRGSMMEITSKAVLETYGITYQDIKSWGGEIFYRATRPALDAMQDDRIDALTTVAPFPDTNINEASINQKFRLLPLSKEAIEQLNRRLGTYRTTIPTGTYRFLKEEIPAIGDTTILIGYAGMSDDLVYRITDALFRNLDYLHGVHRALATLQLSDMPHVSNLPLHAGAARFYREMGVLP